MISADNQKLIDAIKVPEEYAEIVSTILDRCRDYAKQKRYYPLIFNSPPGNNYFCAYKQLASTRGEGEAIIGFVNQGDGLWIIFHHVIVDLKRLTVMLPKDKKHWRRIKIDRNFSEDEIQYICKLAYQCFDKMFK